MGRELISAILLIFIMGLSSAITCNPSSITHEYYQGNTTSSSVQCVNEGNSTTVSLLGNYVSTPETAFSTGSKTIQINFQSTAPLGIHTGTLNFGDGSNFPIFFNVLEPPTQQPTSLISFPTSKTMNVQQGATYNKKVTMIIPSNYPNPINIQTIEFSEENEILSFGDLETGILNQGDIKDIPLVINAQQAQVGTYPPIAVQIRYDDNGQIKTLSSTINIIITANLNPSTNVTFSTPPSCSLSASVLNINNTYSFVCSNVNKNLQINANPYYNEYFLGTGVELSGNIYTYEFRPIKYGNTDFISTFTYMGSQIFSPFKQEVKISTTGSSIPGTNLAFKLTPSLSNIALNEQVIIQLIDNKTGSLVDSPYLEIDAISLIPLNNSPNSFPFTFTENRNYEIRGKSPGYDDIIETLNISKTQLTMTLSPDKSIYQVGDVINITTNVENVSFLLGDTIITNIYTLNSPGNFLLKAKKEGFLDAVKNITIESSVYLGSCSPGDYEKWKKGTKVICDLSKNSTWSVYLEEKDEDSYNPSVLVASGENIVQFKIEKYGIYTIKSNDNVIFTKSVERTSVWYTPWKWGWVKNLGYWWFLILLLAGVGIYFIFSSKKRKSGVGFGTNITGG